MKKRRPVDPEAAAKREADAQRQREELAKGLMLPSFFAGLGMALAVSIERDPNRNDAPWLVVGAVHVVAVGLALFGAHRCRTRGTFGDMTQTTWLAGCAIAWLAGIGVSLLIGWRLS